MPQPLLVPRPLFLALGILGPALAGAQPGALPFKAAPVPGGVAIVPVPGEATAPAVTSPAPDVK